jgi:hypothetical protein
VWFQSGNRYPLAIHHRQAGVQGHKFSIRAVGWPAGVGQADVVSTALDNFNTQRLSAALRLFHKPRRNIVVVDVNRDSLL